MENLKSKEQILLTKKEAIRGCYVYFLLDNNEIVYVGSTKNGEQRIFQHCNSKHFDSYSLIEVNENILLDTENKYILEFKPKYNKAINISKDYLSPRYFKDQYGISKNILNYMEKHFNISTVENVANIRKVYNIKQVKSAFEEMKKNMLIVPYYVSSQHQCRYTLLPKPDRNKLGFE